MTSYVVGTRSALEQRASREVITLTEAHDSPVMTFDIARRLDPKLAHTLLQERLAHNEDKEVSVHTNAQVLGTSCCDVQPVGSARISISENPPC